MMMMTLSNGSFVSATPAARVGSGSEFGPRPPDEIVPLGNVAVLCVGAEVDEPVGEGAGVGDAPGAAVGAEPETDGGADPPTAAPPPHAVKPSVAAVADELRNLLRVKRMKKKPLTRR
jgi:hypothetical protein